MYVIVLIVALAVTVILTLDLLIHVEKEDPSFSPSPVEPLSQGGSREEAEQWSHQSEPSDKVQEIVLEAQHMASYQATLDCISGHGSKPQEVSKRKLGSVYFGIGISLNATQSGQSLRSSVSSSTLRLPQSNRAQSRAAFG